MNDSVGRKSNLHIEYALRPMRVPCPHILEPIFNEADRSAQSACEVRNEHRVLNATLHAVASANIHVLVHTDAIQWNAQRPRDLIRVFWHLDRCPNVENFSPRVPFREYAKGFYWNR